MARFIDELKRTHSCGELREENIDQEIVLFGWVQNRRDHGGCIFIDLRDRDGLTQVVFDPETTGKAAFETADKARSEWVLGVRGKVRDRGAKDDGTSLRNPRLATGAIEVIALEATIFNKAETPPFEIEDQITTGEDKRLEYRYLDLRRAPLQKNLMMRSQLNHEARNYFNESWFPRGRDAVHGAVHAGRRAELPGARRGCTAVISMRSPRARNSINSS